MTTIAIERTTSHKIIAIAYIVGGVIGAISLALQLNRAALHVISALAWLMMSAQVVAAIFGGWQFWCARPIGYQVLYWLSLSCIPVITFSIVSYYCAIGLGASPVLSFGAGNLGVNFYFHFGYASELGFNPGTPGVSIGVNFVAIAFLASIARVMKAARVSTVEACCD